MLYYNTFFTKSSYRHFSELVKIIWQYMDSTINKYNTIIYALIIIQLKPNSESSWANVQEFSRVLQKYKVCDARREMFLSKLVPLQQREACRICPTLFVVSVQESHFVISVIGVESMRGKNIVVILKKQKLTVMSVTTDGLV